MKLESVDIDILLTAASSSSKASQKFIEILATRNVKNFDLHTPVCIEEARASLEYALECLHEFEAGL